MPGANLAREKASSKQLKMCMVENTKVSVTQVILVYNADFSLLGGVQYPKETLSTGKEP